MFSRLGIVKQMKDPVKVEARVISGQRRQSIQSLIASEYQLPPPDDRSITILGIMESEGPNPQSPISNVMEQTHGQMESDEAFPDAPENLLAREDGGGPIHVESAHSERKRPPSPTLPEHKAKRCKQETTAMLTMKEPMATRSQPPRKSAQSATTTTFIPTEDGLATENTVYRIATGGTFCVALNKLLPAQVARQGESVLEQAYSTITDLMQGYTSDIWTRDTIDEIAEIIDLGSAASICPTLLSREGELRMRSEKDRGCRPEANHHLGGGCQKSQESARQEVRWEKR